MGDGVAAEAPSGAGAEQGFTAASGALIQPSTQQVLDGSIERDGALFAPFALQGYRTSTVSTRGRR
ncbi:MULTISPECIES: hypothetical protein [unclassified Streptomyces]|uniref:hypothetical protein n=1 Tax=unclassified Streptomyces TaxID=2593676 RepID=UPI0033AA7190